MGLFKWRHWWRLEFFCNFLFNCTSGCQIWWFFPAFAFRWRSSTFFRYDESFTTLCLHILQRISTFCSLSHLFSDMMKVLWRCVCISPEIFNFLSVNFHFISLSFKNMLENPDNSTWMSQHFAYVIRKYKDKGWGLRNHTKTNDFLEKYRLTFDPPPHFWKIILRIFFRN